MTECCCRTCAESPRLVQGSRERLTMVCRVNLCERVQLRKRAAGQPSWPVPLHDGQGTVRFPEHLAQGRSSTSRRRCLPVPLHEGHIISPPPLHTGHFILAIVVAVAAGARALCREVCTERQRQNRFSDSRDGSRFRKKRGAMSEGGITVRCGGEVRLSFQERMLPCLSFVRIPSLAVG
jgi:hypothetical protein